VPPPGCGRCLHKPFLPRRLREAILDLLGGPPTPSPDAAPGPRTEAVGPGTGLRILVAEDNPIAARVIVTLLRQRGHRVTLAGDGRETLEQARDGGFDLAFVDLRMPGMDGLAFARTYRSGERGGRHLPIIALTADAAEEAGHRAAAAGMDGLLTKPVDPDALDAVIARWGRAAP
jgi:two-component system sensor histidine kinase RpfC